MIKSFFHITLAFIFFISSTGFWINQHLCQAEVVKSNVFLGVKNACNHNKSDMCMGGTMSCSHGAKDDEQKDSCCENHSQYFKIDQDQKIETGEIKLTGPSIGFVSLLPDPGFLFSVNNNQTLHFQNHIPPLIHFDCQVRLQRFLC